ncbi:MAG TPA: hypothetical protein VKA70_04295 [Blastocatellia bacterium]|nr:hypothetical protein [Blastocatellia bacterium]
MKQTASVALVVAALLFLSVSRPAAAQQSEAGQEDPVVKRSDIYCTGYISEAEPRLDLQVVGGDKENQQNAFAQGDVVFLNKGRKAGVQPGAVYYILRPLGEFKHPFKKTRLGHFVRELGMLRVFEVQDYTATAEITVSCDSVELGDVLKPYEQKVGPEARDARPLPRYGEGSNTMTKGQIVMSPTFREYLAANHVVYIDLGTRQGVRPGDYFTIYRKINSREGVAKMPDYDVVNGHDAGYGSRRWKGGEYASSATRESRDKVKRERPEIPRKVLGELIVLKVNRTAAVALITRTVAEVNIGDFIERSY